MSTDSSPPLPVLLFDGDCEFCRFWITRWRAKTGGSVVYHPWQAVKDEYPEIPRETLENAIVLIEPAQEEDGTSTITTGADAVARILSGYTARGWSVGLLSRLPGVMPVARTTYRFIAAHRRAAGGVTRFLWGAGEEAAQPPTWHVATWLFLRLLGIVFACAFGSLLVQIKGLAGSGGILPIAPLLEEAHQQLGSRAYHLFPTLFWWDAGDPMLTGACWAGLCLSVLIFAGLWPGISLLLAWGLYLSLCVAGQTFMTFQWDVLLLETALLAAFLVPLQARRSLRQVNVAGKVSRWLLLFLLFRLMIESAAVKLVSGDPTWADLSALRFHFETQPLPLPTAWWMHQAPEVLLRAGTLGMFLIEFAAPLTLFLPRRLRLLGFWALVGLQIGIAATGNYTFFNLLSASLCVLMLDDYQWPARWRRWLGLPPIAPEGGGDPARPLAPMPEVISTRWGIGNLLLLAPVAFLSVVLGGKGFLEIMVPLYDRSVKTVEMPAWVTTLHQAADPFRSFNRYGLFAMMTTRRPEVVLEGSHDGQTWSEYGFRWKPGDLLKAPPVVAPHQPRLDWQMWFAALGSMEQNPWLLHFMVGLLRNHPEQVAFLGHNPFPDGPPKYIRALRYQYRFTRSGEAWWERDEDGVYCPPLSLRTP